MLPLQNATVVRTAIQYATIHKWCWSHNVIYRSSAWSEVFTAVKIYVVILWVEGTGHTGRCSSRFGARTACIFRGEALSWRQHIHPKRRCPTTALYGAITQKTTIWNKCCSLYIIIMMSRRVKQSHTGNKFLT
jgi:hypothetical protein